MRRRIRYDAWQGATDWRAGVLRGTRDDGDALVIRESAARGTWTSPWVSAGFPMNELVASWSALTPRGGAVEIHARTPHSRWDCLGRWSSDAKARTSVPGQPRVDVDVWRPGEADTYRLRLTLSGRPGGRGPMVRGLGAVASAGAVRTTTSAPLRRRERILDVPRLSQMTWREVGGNGWCSPTAVSMVLSHAGRLPPGTDIPAAAREVFDPAYDGTGNWSFTTAWAATLADHAFVTRLHDLREAEAFVDAGIPLVASVAYAHGELAGAPVAGTDGHLVVIRGFTETGDVVVNDPAAPSARSVRRTYDRGQLERAWLDGSGGTVFVVHNDDQPLPRRRAGGAW